MLVWMTLAAGVLLLAAGVVVVVQVDRQWRREHLQCCRCLQTWFGRDTMCARCGARGKPYDHLTVKFAGFPTHDWQGYLGTGPLPKVAAPIRVAPPADPVPRQRTSSSASPAADPAGHGVSIDRPTPSSAGARGDRSTA